MRVLVTGGAGFIGSHLCDALLARGDEVWCVDNLHLGTEENLRHLLADGAFHFHKADVLDGQAMEPLFAAGRFDGVFHLAANSDIEQGTRDRRVDLRLTFATTFEVLELLHRHGVKRVFFASSSAVFGEAPGTLAETSGPLEPVSFYGAAKLASEAYLSVYAHTFGIQTRVLRFPNVVGERATHGVIYDFVRRLRTDPTRLRVLGDGNQTKPYLYVKDLVEAILLVDARATEPYAVYHVAGDGATSVRQIADIVVAEMGLTGTAVEYGEGRTGWVGDMPQYHYDSAKIHALGFRPRYPSTEAVRVAVQRMLGR